MLPDGRLDDPLRGHVAAEVEDLVAVILQDHFYDVLADIVDVALHGREDDPALDRGLSAGRDPALDLIEALLRDVRRQDELGQEEGALFKFPANNVERGDQDAVDHVHRVRVGEISGGETAAFRLHAGLHGLQDLPHALCVGKTGTFGAGAAGGVGCIFQM